LPLPRGGFALDTGGVTWKAPPGWRKIRQQVFAVKGRSCWRCGAYATTVDHVVPVVLGGGHGLANLRPACSRCNYSAGASLGNRIGPPRGYRRRGSGASASWITSRDW
jgi:5-methylcytosine-specific restriction endonuclease McrA